MHVMYCVMFRDLCDIKWRKFVIYFSTIIWRHFVIQFVIYVKYILS